jgi:hypothetical protein
VGINTRRSCYLIYFARLSEAVGAGLEGGTEYYQLVPLVLFVVVFLKAFVHSIYPVNIAVHLFFGRLRLQPP